MRAIRPDVDFDPAPDAYMSWGRGRIENFSGARVRALVRLDANQKVFVTGGAGTGKSRLALVWKRPSAMRSEQVANKKLIRSIMREQGKRGYRSGTRGAGT